MIKPVINMLASEISHMPLHLVWRDSGVTQEHGFDLVVHVANAKVGAPLLLDGTYDFLSGLHHEPYIYRARGDKRFSYLAQAQNDWDDRIIAREEIQTAKDLEGKKILITARAPCVYGNLRHSLELAGADLEKIEFVDVVKEGPGRGSHSAVKQLARGEAAAASVDAPFDLQGEKYGLHRLYVPTVPVIHNATMCANDEWVRKNEDTTIAFLESMIDAIHFFKTEKSKVCSIIEKELAQVIGLEGPDEIEHLQETWAGLLSPKPYPHPLAVWNVYNLDVAHDPAVNHIGPFEIWNTSYLRAIDDSGYIDELYGGAVAIRNPAVNPAI
jgi:ABC-type nitrate/sulfonate/bicarbonate transport system substrate-binding protein